MKRVHKVFETPYRALRDQLFKAAGVIALADFSRPAACRAAVQAISNLLLLLRERQQLEANFVLPLLAATDAAEAQSLVADQQQLGELGQELQALTALVLDRVHAPDVDAAASLQPVVASLLHGLVAEQLLYMQRQEHDAQAVLERHHSHDALSALGARMQQSLPLRRQAHWRRLVCAAVAPQAAAAWLASVDHADGPALAASATRPRFSVDSRAFHNQEIGQ